jgi:hypothetical protein
MIKQAANYIAGQVFPALLLTLVFSLGFLLMLTCLSILNSIVDFIF